MPFTLTMPKLSPTMDVGTITKWHKKVGEHVEDGELIFEVATDKATVEHNALDGGWLRKILVSDGQEAYVNQAIAIFTEQKDESIENYKSEGLEPIAAAQQETHDSNEETSIDRNEGSTVEQAPRRGGGLQQPSFVPEAPLENYSFEFPSQTIEKRVMASPLAKRLAKEKGLDISEMKGSGPNERIMSRDLDHAPPAGTIAFGRREVPSIAPGTYEEESMSPIRKIIGQRLQESKSFIPHFYVQQTVMVEALIAARDQLKTWGTSVSFNDLVVRACALSLREHPIVNSGFNSVNQTIIHFKTIDIAVAVSVEGGLITPIVRHADFKNLGEISLEIRHLAKQARDGKLIPEQYKGGSFTISNLGMYGVVDFQAIINPPQAAILAVSAILDAPVIKGDAVVPGKVMNLTLSVDHRVIDGVAAAEFLRTLKHSLENPAGLLI